MNEHFKQLIRDYKVTEAFWEAAENVMTNPEHQEVLIRIAIRASMSVCFRTASTRSKLNACIEPSISA